MSPKTVLIKKEHNSESRKESDQTSFSENKLELNMTDQSKSSTDLALNLGSNLRNDIINSLIKFSCLLRGQTVATSDKEKLFGSNTELIQRLSILTSGDKGHEDNLNLINGGFRKDSNERNGGLFFELNLSERLGIFDLLTRNFTSLFLSECSVSEKENLAKENNEMVNHLLNLVAKHLETVNDGDCDQTLSNLSTNRAEHDLIERVNKLEREIKEVDIRNNETTFYFEIANFQDFLDSLKKVRSNFFYCSSLPWLLILSSFNEKDGTKSFDVKLMIGEFTTSYKWSVKIGANLLLKNRSGLNASPISFSLTNKRELEQVYSVSHDKLVDYIQDNTFKIGIQMKADMVFQPKI